MIAPPGGEVDWPTDEGILGVVGVAPWATLEFLRALHAEVRVEKDWHYPRVLVDSNPKIPSRGRHLELGESDPSPALAATLRELADHGATVGVVICNTAHLLFDRWAPEAPIPVLHIVEETARHAAASGARRVASLTSRSLARAGLYESCCRAAGLEPDRPTPTTIELVSELIEAVKRHGELDEPLRKRAAERMGAVRERGVDTVLAGCTELSVLRPIAETEGLRFVDSNRALARACLDRMDYDRDRRRGRETPSSRGSAALP